MMLSIESAIVGLGVSGFAEFIISGKEKINANTPIVNASLLLTSEPLSKINIAPKRKNIAIIGTITMAEE